MSPTFPHFKPLHITDREALIQFASRFPDYTEFNFSYMFLWDLREHLMFCFLNDNLVVRFIDIQTGKPFISLLGDNLIDETVDTLIDYAEVNHFGDFIQNIPDVVIKALRDKHHYTVIEDKRYNDYVLSVQGIAEYEGNEFVKKRNLLKKFTELHGHKTTSREIDINEPKVRQEVLLVLEKWRSTYRGDEISDIDYEFKAIERAIRHHNDLELRVFGTYIDKTLESFTVFEIVDTKSVIIHFDKANKSFKGLTEHHKNSLSKHLRKEDVEIINYQDDMGIEELRRSKESYRPIAYLRKYKLSHTPEHKNRRKVLTSTI